MQHWHLWFRFFGRAHSGTHDFLRTCAPHFDTARRVSPHCTRVLEYSAVQCTAPPLQPSVLCARLRGPLAAPVPQLQSSPSAAVRTRALAQALTPVAH